MLRNTIFSNKISAFCKQFTGTLGLSTQQFRNVSTTVLENLAPSKDATFPSNDIETISNEILKRPDFFQVSKLFTVEDLFKSRVHLGHREGTLNPYMLPYIYGSRLDHLIIDLDQTAELLKEALNFAAHIAFRDGIILFVCRSPAHQVLVEQVAMECKEYAHTREFIQGTFTDSSQTFGCNIRLPDLVIALNTLDTTINENLAIVESAKMRIPTIGVVDTNCDPRLITYPIPGNDDSHASITLFCQLFKSAILQAKAKRKSLLGL